MKSSEPCYCFTNTRIHNRKLWSTFHFEISYTFARLFSPVSAAFSSRVLVASSSYFWSFWQIFYFLWSLRKVVLMMMLNSCLASTVISSPKHCFQSELFSWIADMEVTFYHLNIFHQSYYLPKTETSGIGSVGPRIPSIIHLQWATNMSL